MAIVRQPSDICKTFLGTYERNRNVLRLRLPCEAAQEMGHAETILIVAHE